MMKGALHQLLGSSTEAAQLREQFVFKVRWCWYSTMHFLALVGLQS
jgi:hypothetical protein